ncbi:hypothetical protein Tco_0417334 [Tanacetum coccineum]
MHRLPVEGYKNLSKNIGVPQHVIELCVRYYFYNESKKRSTEVTETFKQYNAKNVKTFTNEEEKKKYFNEIQARAFRAMEVIKWTQEGKMFENIASTLNINVKSVRQFVKFFYSFREIVLNRETIKPGGGLEASGTHQSEKEKNSEGPEAYSSHVLCKHHVKKVEKV